MRSVCALPFVLILLLAVGCGGGTLGDVWSSFPDSAFGPPPGEDPGQDPGGEPFIPVEVAALGGGQGVTGDVRNIALGEDDGRNYAFLTAGADGVHIVDITEPDLLNSTNVVATIAPALLNGMRADAIAAVENSFLVVAAVGTGAANAITVFAIPLLIEAALAGDPLAGGVVPLDAAAVGIAVPGNSVGRGGGISGGSGIFFVATGGPTVATATVDLVAGTWSEAAPLVTTAATVETYDVRVNATLAVYASVMQDTGDFGFVALSHPLSPFPTPPNFVPIDGEFDRFNDEFIAGPGNYALDMSIDGLTLYVAEDEEVQVYNITNPIGPTLLNTIENTDIDTIAVSAAGGTVAVGAGDAVRLFTNFAGQTQSLGSVTFSGTFTIRGVAVTTTDRGTFALCCAGAGGVRVVQVTEPTQR